MTIPYAPPKQDSDAYNCAHCHAFARHYHSVMQTNTGVMDSFVAHRCTRCNHYTVWHDGALVYPEALPGPLAVAEMPDAVRADYEEARAISVQSPRGAAALLRLAIQKLVGYLGANEKDLNAGIGELVRRGLPTKIQQALDVVRVVGNNAVHPGQIDLQDDRAMADHLFSLVNLIVEVMVVQPKAVEQLFNSLPESARQAIEKRDSKPQK